jgi:hypothetical protein
MFASRRAPVAAVLLSVIAGGGGDGAAGEPTSTLPPRTYVAQGRAPGLGRRVRPSAAALKGGAPGLIWRP